MKICSVCRREFPDEVMCYFSPGGIGKIYECAECHDRACNGLDALHVRKGFTKQLDVQRRGCKQAS